MKQRKAKPGLIIPTALFVAMFVLLISNVLVASVSMNLNMSLGSLEATEARYLSFAAVNELLSDLSAGTVAVTDHTKSNPHKTFNGGYTSETWVEPLGGGNVLVVAQTYRSSQSKPEVVKRLAIYREYDQTRVYTNKQDNDPASPDPIFYSDASGSADWSQLPELERQRLKDDGTIETRPGEKAGTMFWVAGDPNGSMYGTYVPSLDGWGDIPSPLSIFPASVVPFPWGKITLKTLVAGSRQGMTIGDLTPIAQCLINNLTDLSATKGAVMMKYDFGADQWKPLPPPEEATISNGQAVVHSGDYHIKGAAGVPATYDGGALMPIFRKGPDTLYRYTEATQKFEVLVPPAKDIIVMAADQQGTPFVQGGTIQGVGLDYFLRVLLEDFSDIKPQVTGASLNKYTDGQWTRIADPPARFYNKNGALVDGTYTSRGPVLGGMAGGENGEFYVCNRPTEDNLSNPRSTTGLVDTLYKFNSQGEWELVPSPPNKAFDPVTGQELDKPGLPQRMEIGQGTNGKLILRLSGTDGPDPIFVQTQGGSYDLLPPVRTEGGPFQDLLVQVSGGRKREGTRGSYVIKATYF